MVQFEPNKMYGIYLDLEIQFINKVQKYLEFVRDEASIKRVLKTFTKIFEEVSKERRREW